MSDTDPSIPPCKGSFDYDGRCTVCGQNYHCAKCGRGTGMMGHNADPERCAASYKRETTT